MAVEEYEHDLLTKGTYFKKGDSIPVSRVQDGEGVATLFDRRGHFLKKVNYAKSRPVVE